MGWSNVWMQFFAASKELYLSRYEGKGVVWEEVFKNVASDL